jgi:hypothetical protein
MQHQNFVLFLFACLPCRFVSQAQPKPFVPLQFEYPESVLTAPKTYVYKNMTTGAFRYRDVSLERNAGNVIVHWKEYDESPLIDSCTEINDKGLDHYFIVKGESIKAEVTEDSVHQDGSRLGEKVQTLYFNLNPAISFFVSIHSRFLKDTSLVWQGRTVPCLVIQSYDLQKISNSQMPAQDKEMSGIVYYYFGKDVGLLLYRTETDSEKATWQLTEIRGRKN